MLDLLNLASDIMKPRDAYESKNMELSSQAVITTFKGLFWSPLSKQRSLGWPLAKPLANQELSAHVVISISVSYSKF